MDFYLASQGFGSKPKEFKKMVPKRNKNAAYIANAMDYSKNFKRLARRNEEYLNKLKELGLKPEILDLRDYFHKKKALARKMKKFGVIWVKGGNVFVLRQAMKLSGFDEIFKSLVNKKILYGGSSAGICILAPSLRGLELVDPITKKPYGKKIKTIWSGLGALEYLPIPHYKSKNKHSKAIDRTVAYCIKNKILFRTLTDKETFIVKN